MKNNGLSIFFKVIGTLAVIAGCIVFLVWIINDYPSDQIIISTSTLLSGLLFLAIAEVIKLLSKIEYNTRKEE